MANSDFDECECGHYRDEHVNGRDECQADGCFGGQCSCPMFALEREDDTD